MMEESTSHIVRPMRTPFGVGSVYPEHKGTIIINRPADDAPDNVWLCMVTNDGKAIGTYLEPDEAEEVALAMLIRVKELRDAT